MNDGNAGRVDFRVSAGIKHSISGVRPRTRGLLSGLVLAGQSVGLPGVMGAISSAQTAAEGLLESDST